MQEVPITFNGANQTTYVKHIMCLALSTIFTSWLRLQNIVGSSGSKENTQSKPKVWSNYPGEPAAPWKNTIIQAKNNWII